MRGRYIAERRVPEVGRFVVGVPRARAWRHRCGPKSRVGCGISFGWRPGPFTTSGAGSTVLVQWVRETSP